MDARCGFDVHPVHRHRLYPARIPERMAMAISP
jgi:hypothetical protein